MSTQTYNFYMSYATLKSNGEYDVIRDEDGTPSDVRDLETDENFNFDDGTRLKYCKCVGLEDVGEARIYTEEYADSDRIRVLIPEKITHKPTEVKLTLVFVGDKRRLSYNNFNEWLNGRTMAYWDSARKKRLFFYVKSSTKPSEDKFLGSTPYIEATYTLSNIMGKTEDKTFIY